MNFWSSLTRQRNTLGEAPVSRYDGLNVARPNCITSVSSLSKAARARANRHRFACSRARLREIAREVVVTREPGGTPLAEKLRAFILAGKAREFGALGEAVLFSAARIDHIDQLIRPALARGAIVLCDRFADSTRAYQGVKGGVAPGQLAALEKVTLAGLTPGMTFILDLPPQIGLERANRRRGGGEADRFEGEALDFHAQLRARFLEIAQRRAAALPGDRRRTSGRNRRRTRYGRRFPRNRDLRPARA